MMFFIINLSVRIWAENCTCFFCEDRCSFVLWWMEGWTRNRCSSNFIIIIVICHSNHWQTLLCTVHTLWVGFALHCRFFSSALGCRLQNFGSAVSLCFWCLSNLNRNVSVMSNVTEPDWRLTRWNHQSPICTDVKHGPQAGRAGTALGT
jgi:hypothetical protein